MDPAYVTAVRLLARRELSEAQVRQRLARKQFDGDAIEAAIARLKEERALDDVRVAEAIARTQTAIKKRGRVRVRQHLQQAGISGSTARQVLDEVFSGLDGEALIGAALDRRLRAGRLIADDQEFARLYRYLLAQGFDADAVREALSRRRQAR
jgi:regulatory protein